MERRKYPRQAVAGPSLRATLVLLGSSLIQEHSYTTFEIDAQPIDLSRSGVGLALRADMEWETLSPSHEVQLSLEKGPLLERLRGTIVYLNRKEHRVGLEFDSPLNRVSHLFVPSELE